MIKRKIQWIVKLKAIRILVVKLYDFNQQHTAYTTKDMITENKRKLRSINKIFGIIKWHEKQCYKIRPLQVPRLNKR